MFCCSVKASIQISFNCYGNNIIFKYIFKGMPLTEEALYLEDYLGIMLFFGCCFNYKKNILMGIRQIEVQHNLKIPG